MPAKSKAQRRLMGACEHGAGYASCPKSMTKAQMHDFAVTKEKGLPQHVMKPKKYQAGISAVPSIIKPPVVKPPRMSTGGMEKGFARESGFTKAPGLPNVPAIAKVPYFGGSRRYQQGTASVAPQVIPPPGHGKIHNNRHVAAAGQMPVMPQAVQHAKRNVAVPLPPVSMPEQAQY